MARGSANNSSTANPGGAATSGSSPSVEDSGSPYFLSNGDHPGLILVTHILTGPNFNSWSRAMLLALTAKNKSIFVDGSLLRPSSDNLSFSAWNRCNSMVISWLLNSISKDIADSLMYFTNAYDAWFDLRTRFHQANGPRIFQLKLQISSLHQDASTVNGYYTRLKTLWDELFDYSPSYSCTCGALRSISHDRDQDHAMHFLMGLNDSFSSIRAQILLMDPLPSLSKVFSLVLQEERQREITTSVPLVTDGPLFSSAAPPPTVAAASGAPPRRQRPLCSHCNILGHTKEKCFKLHGYPPGYQPKSPRPTHNPLHTPIPRPSSNAVVSPSPTFTHHQYQQLLSLLPPPSIQNPQPSSPPLDVNPTIASLNGEFPSSLPPTCWVLDTGATHHVSCAPLSSTLSPPASDSVVTLPNGPRMLMMPGSIYVPDSTKPTVLEYFSLSCKFLPCTKMLRPLMATILA
ncbi:uncharacterized protein LOC133297958 [Gastrolobium bilobum]|uniref:uncharacterized protein LOC133297958 n=1 Tax=Gastrolobium bilobum TaxID=150636 RepID=UPI002AAFCDF2|nr:uncharacterized protein LOC133297958 [Gastrolobium bilobum]